MNARILIPAFAMLSASSFGQLVVYNSHTPDQNKAAQDGFYREIGIAGPQFFVDFESGFTDGQTVSGQSGLFPGGLIIGEANGRRVAIVQQGPGSIDLSNPVGSFALSHSSQDILVFDFSANPVDYFAFNDIDTVSNNSWINLYFTDGTVHFHKMVDATYTTGDSAEFLGFYRNDLARISRVEFDLGGTDYGVDNLQYGAVPEPATLAALGLGAAALLRRRKK